MIFLALELYYGDSHTVFIDGWIDNREHDRTLLTQAKRGGGPGGARAVF
jgi:hypothetical protein